MSLQVATLTILIRVTDLEALDPVIRPDVVDAVAPIRDLHTKMVAIVRETEVHAVDLIAGLDPNTVHSPITCLESVLHPHRLKCLRVPNHSHWFYHLLLLRL